MQFKRPELNAKKRPPRDGQCPATAKLVVALIGIHGLEKQETCRWTNSISTGRLPFDERPQWQVWSLD